MPLEPALSALAALAAALLYGAGTARLWRRAGRRAIRPWRIACLAGGIVCGLTAAFMAHSTLAGHMLQHVLLIAAAPPLLVLARPLAAAGAVAPALARRLGKLRLPPVAATALHGATLWFWHTPALFDAAVAEHALHLAEHLSLFVTALLFWEAVLRPGGAAVRAAGAGCLLLAMLHMGMLGAVLTLAGRPLFDSYPDLADQQLAGLAMWIPVGFVHLVAGVWLMALAIAAASRRAAGPARPPPQAAPAAAAPPPRPAR